ncbi:DUF1987 domain-containing protein [Flammeovirgaceae bacterium SG7u.111]|nr:DUF1987 domain-containing protein [Flammeovirgaceae bacterium SG7u.132]WPO37538.1 DUF1987 domain-containing protein [Flammeovirgaceae bacterium SG7u.111]
METLNLEKLEIKEEKGTFFIPKVNFDPITGTCELSGESYLEDTWQFYEKLINWLKTYTSAGTLPIEFKIKLAYYNTSSSKSIVDILKLLKNYQETGAPVNVKWYYLEDDEDSLMDAEDMIADTGIEMDLIAYDE